MKSKGIEGMTIETEDVVARLAGWSNDPDDEPPIVLMMDAKAEIQSLSDRIDVLEGALKRARRHVLWIMHANYLTSHDMQDARASMLVIDAALTKEAGIHGQ